jgi:outer membrane protein assembly factor BamB
MKRTLTTFFLSLIAAATTAAQPVITSLSADALERSGRLLVGGASFGVESDSSRVEIGGIPAAFTRWSDSLIVAYVPEAAALGAAGVQVFTTDGASNEMSVEVTPRVPPQDGVAWRFEADSDDIRNRPAVGADGTIYTTDIGGHLYALTPDGGLKWVFNDLDGVGNKGVTLGVDDTIYVGSERAITAINPDGSLRWRFMQSPRAFILLGPNVGPDGNIYAVAIQGLGVFSLTPDGNLRWSVLEPYRRPIVDIQEIVFGPRGTGFQLYFQANDHLQGMELDGTTTFSNPGSTDTLLGDPQPAVGPDGTIYANRFDTPQGLRLKAFDPSGNRLWTFPDDDDPTNVLSTPDVGPDGIIYDGRNLLSLHAVNPDGTERWRYTDSGILFGPAVSPNNDLIFLGGRVTYGQPGFFVGISTAGALLWRIALPSESGHHILPNSRARFANDGQTVYIGTAIPGQEGVNEHSYLYAVPTVR